MFWYQRLNEYYLSHSNLSIKDNNHFGYSFHYNKSKFIEK